MVFDLVGGWLSLAGILCLRFSHFKVSTFTGLMKPGTCDRYAKEIKLREREKQQFFAAVIYLVALAALYLPLVVFVFVSATLELKTPSTFDRGDE